MRALAGASTERIDRMVASNLVHRRGAAGTAGVETAELVRAAGRAAPRARRWAALAGAYAR